MHTSSSAAPVKGRTERASLKGSLGAEPFSGFRFLLLKLASGWWHQAFRQMSFQI